MGGPKPVRPLTSKGAKGGSFEKPSNTKKLKKNKTKPVDSSKHLESKAELTKTSNKTKQVVSSDRINVTKSSSTKTESRIVKIEDSQIIEAVRAFSKLLEINNSDTSNKNLFSSEGQKVSLQIAGIKLPRDSEAQVLKIRLPHSPLSSNNDVCLFVKDLEKGLKVDHEGTVNHFNSLLVDKGVKHVTQVISLRELKVEYKQFEAKTQLCHRFDTFLADSRIIRFLPQFLGKAFYKRKKLPIQVNLQAKDLAKEVENCINTAVLPLRNAGSCSRVVIGTSTHNENELVENIKTVVRSLEDKYPGGWVNIRSIHINAGSSSLPLYVSMRSTSDVGLVKGGKKANRSVVIDELSTVVGGTVVVTPSGVVKVKRKADPEWTENDESLTEMISEERSLETEGDDADESNGKQKEQVSVVKSDKASKKQKTQEDDSDDDMEDQELEYMKKVAEEEEALEKELEERDSQMNEKLQQEDKVENEDSEDDDEKYDDEAEAEDLLSDGDSSESEDELVMKNISNAEEEEDEELDVKKKSKKKKTQPVNNSKKKDTKLKEKSSNKKAKKQKKFIDSKKAKKSK